MVVVVVVTLLVAVALVEEVRSSTPCKPDRFIVGSRTFGTTAIPEERRFAVVLFLLTEGESERERSGNPPPWGVLVDVPTPRVC